MASDAGLEAPVLASAMQAWRACLWPLVALFIVGLWVGCVPGCLFMEVRGAPVLSLVELGVGWAGHCFPDSQQAVVILLGPTKGSAALHEALSLLPGSSTEALTGPAPSNPRVGCFCFLGFKD